MVKSIVVHQIRVWIWLKYAHYFSRPNMAQQSLCNLFGVGSVFFFERVWSDLLICATTHDQDYGEVVKGCQLCALKFLECLL